MLVIGSLVESLEVLIEENLLIYIGNIGLCKHRPALVTYNKQYFVNRKKKMRIVSWKKIPALIQIVLLLILVFLVLTLVFISVSTKSDQVNFFKENEQIGGSVHLYCQLIF